MAISPPIKLNVSAPLLRIAHRFASTEETRYYLNGVDIRPHPEGTGVLLTATDGVTLFGAHDPDGSVSQPIILLPSPGLLRSMAAPDPWKWALTKAALQQNLRLQASFTSGRALTRLSASWERNGEPYTEVVGGGIASLIDGTYPRVDRILPEKVNTDMAAISSNTLDRVCKAVKDLAAAYGLGKTVAIGMNLANSEPGIIRIAQLPVFLLVMPMRYQGNEPECGVPSWFQWREATGAAPAEAAE